MEINSNNFNEAMNCSLTINSDSNDVFSIGRLPSDSTANSGTITTTPVYDYYWNWWYPNYHVQWERSKVDLAFKILKVLSDKKLINLEKLTVGKFITIVNDLAKEL